MGDFMYFKENLRYLRHINQESQNTLANMLNYKSYTTIQKWEDGTSMPSVPVLKRIAEHYCVPFEDLCHRELQVLNNEYTRIPIIGEVKAGYGLLAQENITDFEYVPLNESQGGIYFYLDVVGDSMKDARILEGDRVFCRQQNSLENGEIGVILLENEEVTLKRVLFKDATMILKSENSTYPELIFSEDEITNKGIRILGKLIHNKINF